MPVPTQIPIDLLQRYGMSPQMWDVLRQAPGGGTFQSGPIGSTLPEPELAAQSMQPQPRLPMPARPPMGSQAPLQAPQRQLPPDVLTALGVPAERREGALRALTGMAEGFGSIRTTTPGHILSGAEPPPPFVAEGSRTALANEMDVLKPDEETFLRQKLGLTVQPGMKRSFLNDMLPGVLGQRQIESRERMGMLQSLGDQVRPEVVDIVNKIRAGETPEVSPDLGLTESELRFIENARYGQEIGGRAEARRELSSRALDLSLRREERMADRMRDILRRETSLPAAVRKDVRMVSSAYKGLNRFEENYRAALAKNPDLFGPLYGRWQKILATVGIEDPEYAKVQAELTDALGQYITSRTGAQRGMTEVAWLATRFPQLFKTGANIDAVLQDLKWSLEEEMDTFEETYGDFYSLEPISRVKEGTMGMKPGETPHSAPGAGQKTMRRFTLNGKAGDVPEDQVEAFLKKYPNAVEVK